MCETYLAALLCAISIPSCAVDVCGFQAHEAYSSAGLTRAWYARILTIVDDVRTFILTNPNVRLALAVIAAMCLFQVRSDVIVMPRYLADFTVARAWPWRVYCTNMGWRIFVIEILLHLAGLKFICVSSELDNIGRVVILYNLFVSVSYGILLHHLQRVEWGSLCFWEVVDVES